MKKLEIEKTKPTFIISVLKVDIIKVGLVFSISNFFITETPLANNWRRKKIPSCSYSALEYKTLHHKIPSFALTSLKIYSRWEVFNNSIHSAFFNRENLQCEVQVDLGKGSS